MGHSGDHKGGWNEQIVQAMEADPAVRAGRPDAYFTSTKLIEALWAANDAFGRAIGKPVFAKRAQSAISRAARLGLIRSLPIPLGALNRKMARYALVRAVPLPDGANDRNAPEPPPIPNEQPAAWDLVIADMRARDHFGRAKYGTPLQPNNGRDQLSDAYQEALDLAVYLRTALYERDGK